jgi:hypothetical protein
MGRRLTCGIRPRSTWNGPGIGAVNFEDDLEEQPAFPFTTAWMPGIKNFLPDGRDGLS